MIILTGASASGKSVVAKILIEKYHFEKVVTYTTRPIRQGEENGVDYHFVSNEQFQKMLEEKKFLESIIYHQNYYGTAHKDINGLKVLIVDLKGANVYFDKIGKKAFYVHLQTDKEIRKQRMIERGDKLETIVQRLEKDIVDFDYQQMKHLDLLINTDKMSVNEIADYLYQQYCGYQNRKLFFRQSLITDLDGIMLVIEDAKKLLKANNSRQWQDSDGYPNKETFLNDYQNNLVYVIVDNETIVAVAVLSFTPDECYKMIDGKWINDENYGVIHRLAVKKEYYGTGVAKKMFDELERIVQENKCFNIRIDTAEENKAMIKILTNKQYQYCGKIKLLRTACENPYRLAFHKKLNENKC